MKTNLDKVFKTSTDKEKEGIWFPVNDEVSFRIRRMFGSNARRNAEISSKYYGPYASQIKLKTLSEEKQDELALKIFIESTIIDWKGIKTEDENGEEKDFPFTMENAVQLFESMPDLREAIMEASMDAKNFKEDLGNS